MDNTNTSMHLSCPQCRKRKIKCDRKFPCGQCKVRGEEDYCQAVIRKYNTLTKNDDQTTKIIDNGDYNALLQRLNQLEGRVQRLEDKDNKKEEQEETIIQQQQPSYTLTNADHERVSLMVEDVAMGHLGKRSRFDEQINGSNKRKTDNDVVRQQFQDTTSILQQRTRDHVIDLIYTYKQFLPNQEITFKLIEFYFQDISWFTDILDKNTFFQQYQEWANFSFDEKHIDPCFFSLLLIVLTLSLHMMNEEDLRDIGILKTVDDKFSHIHLAQSLFAATQQVLWSSNFLGNCQLDHLACIVLMGLYQYDIKDESDAHWILLGSAIKAAQNLELADMQRSTFWNKSDPQTQKRAKEIWWMLIWYDWSHAFGHDGRYSIIPSQNKNWIPDSTSLQNDNTLFNFTVARGILVNFYREVTDLYNLTDGKLTYEHREHLDVELDKVIKHIPNRLLVSSDNTSHQAFTKQELFEQYFITLTIENRILRLHRPFQVEQQENLTSQEANSSRQKCLKAASRIVTLLNQATPICSTLLRFWVITLYGLGAGLVLIIEQHLLERQSDEVEKQLDILCGIFARNQRRSASSRNAFKLLRILRKMNRGQTWKHTQPSGKNTILKQIADTFLQQASSGRSRSFSDSSVEKEDHIPSNITIDPDLQNWGLQNNSTDLPDLTFSNWQQALGAYGMDFDLNLTA